MSLIEFNEKVGYDDSQAIVVLGGFVSIVKSDGVAKLQWGGADRFFKAVEYAKLHPRLYLVFTNEKLPWMDFSSGTGKLLTYYAISFGVLPEQVLITRDVQNTQDEAIEVARLLRSKGIKKIILVTSAFHMQRALFLFSNAGLEIRPMPVDYRGNQEDIGILKYIPSVSALSMTDMVVRELCLRFYYLLSRNYFILRGQNNENSFSIQV